MADRNYARGSRAHRTLTIDPRIRRIGAAYFDGAVLAEWTIRNVRQDPLNVRVRKRLIPAVIRMLDRYEPTTLLIPDTGAGGVRRSANVRLVIEAVSQEARNRGIDVVAVGEKQVKQTFETARRGSARSMHRIGELIAEWFPELGPQRPKARRVWDSESHATPLFAAIARWVAWRGLPPKAAIA